MRSRIHPHYHASLDDLTYGDRHERSRAESVRSSRLSQLVDRHTSVVAGESWCGDRETLAEGESARDVTACFSRADGVRKRLFLYHSSGAWSWPIPFDGSRRGARRLLPCG